MQQTVVYKDANAYSCFPGLCRRHNGDLWLCFRRAGEFSLEAIRRGGHVHVDIGARIVLTRSADGGRTWDAPRMLGEFDAQCSQQGPSIAALRSGALLVHFFHYRIAPADQKQSVPHAIYQLPDGSWAQMEGPYVVCSFDGGDTWESSLATVDCSPLRAAAVADAVIELPDGSLLMALYGTNAGDRMCLSYVVRSTDGGATWGQPALIAGDPQRQMSFEEPAISLTPSGGLIAILRTAKDGVYQNLHSAFSHDGGHTWTPPQPTSMWGYPAHVFTALDGRMVCSYGYRRQPYGVRACASADGGQTWDIAHEYILHAGGATVDLGYPASVQLPDGEIVTAYYTHGADTVRHIVCAHWRLD